MEHVGKRLLGSLLRASFSTLEGESIRNHSKIRRVDGVYAYIIPMSLQVRHEIVCLVTVAQLF